jgi:hypothetical protein
MSAEDSRCTGCVGIAHLEAGASSVESIGTDGGVLVCFCACCESGSGAPWISASLVEEAGLELVSAGGSVSIESMTGNESFCLGGVSIVASTCVAI